MRSATATIVLFLGLGFSSYGQEAASPSSAPSDTAARNAPDAPASSDMRRGVTPPKVLSVVDPEYSEKARKKKINGFCLVTLVVGADGIPTDVRIARSLAETQPQKLRDAAVSLDDKAVEAVRQYRFRPAMRQGQPVAAKLNIEVKFQVF